jgi:BTB/POZ domain
MTSQADELFAKAMLLQQETAAGKRKADVMLIDLEDNCEPKRARTLVDNPEFANRVLHINGSFYHAHSQLLAKRCSSFETLLGPDCTADAVIKLNLPSTDKYAFKVLLEYLYTGELPDATLMAQYSVHLAEDAHFLNIDKLYDACVKYLGKSWHAEQKLNPDTFGTDMTMLLMQDVLKAMRAPRDKLLLMAATCSTETEDWTQVVKQHVRSTAFAAELTHGLMIKLHSEVDAQLVSSDVIKVLDLIPNAVAVAASQRTVQTHTTRKQCTRCGRHVTKQDAKYDKDGCIIYKHTGSMLWVLGGNSYSCCKSICREGGCVEERHSSHTIAEPFG